MGLPKNYQQKVNLPKRIKALNNLTFYTFKYKLTLDEDFMKKLYEELDNNVAETMEEFIGSITITKNGDTFGEKRFSAVNSVKATQKWDEWMSKAVDMEIISEYEAIEVTQKTFKEELESKKLLDILNIKENS